MSIFRPIILLSLFIFDLQPCEAASLRTRFVRFLDVAVDEINAVALLEETSHGQERAISRKTGRVLVAFSLGIGISLLLMILALALQRRVYADAYRAAAMDIPVAPKERRGSSLEPSSREAPNESA
ncbi:hypothetical protein FOZ60_001797 [Perkinsus olseni]|uniref:Transmembrane protein n=1 Tax=Perkinsus olseni TaxID=32597 RepID=A0A7J6NZM7_PEROL|nr:hypothetical protein FOZ60_001797 [Perkinsus olseni]